MQDNPNQMAMAGSGRHGPPDSLHGQRYDELVSCLQKAIRRCDEELALRTAVELSLSGFDAALWRRLIVISIEDVGHAEPGLEVRINALHDLYGKLAKKKDDRMQTWRLPLISSVLLLARAHKSYEVSSALIAFYGEQVPPQVPDHAIDRHTFRGKQRGKTLDDFWTEGSLLVNPDTGEISEAPCIPDRYRDRAVEVTKR